MTKIQDETFCKCRNLNNVKFPSTLTSIGKKAFNECNSLTRIILPSSLTEIGYYAFRNCANLEQIEISDRVTDIGGYAFDGTPWFEKKKNESDTGFVIINHILLDGTKAEGSITIPDTVKKINIWAFVECDGLTEIVIPDSVTEIKDAAFSKCKNLSKVVIPESVTTIGDSAFYQCESLTSVTIPKGVTELEKHTFSGCTALADIYIPAGITRIDGNAFYNTAWIDQRRSESNNSLVIVNDILIDGHKANGNVQIPDTVKKIACWAFINNNDLTGVTLGQITEIESEAFRNCKGLTAIQIPDSITKIGDAVFAETGLKEITFPENVKEIGCGAVLGCSNLEKVTITNKKADVIKSDADGTPNIFGVKGGDNEFVDVQKVVTYKGKNICIVGHKDSTAYALADHIYKNAADYGYQTVRFTDIDNDGTNQPEPDPSPTPAPDAKALLEEVKVTSNLDIRKGKSGQIEVTLPKGLIKANAYTSEEGQVKITYKSNKKKVAIVNKKGKVTGKKQGSTKILTTVSLQDGTKKIFQTKIKVK